MTYGNRLPVSTEGVPHFTAARTVTSPLPDIYHLQECLQDYLGDDIPLDHPEPPHVTYLSPASWKDASQIIAGREYTPDDLESLQIELENYLDQQSFTGELTVPVLEQQPISWIGFGLRKVALMLTPTDELMKGYGHIESFFRDKFDRRLRIRSARPHITLGAVALKSTLEAHQRNVQYLSTEDTIVPTQVTLSGLQVYLGKIPSAPIAV